MPERWWDIDGSFAVSSSINYFDHEFANVPGQSPATTSWTGLPACARASTSSSTSSCRATGSCACRRLLVRLRLPDPGAEQLHPAGARRLRVGGRLPGHLPGGPPAREPRSQARPPGGELGPLSDTLRVLDVLNPLDNREPGRADIEDLRRPVTMVKLDWHIGRNWRLTGIAIPEIRFDDLPALGTDFVGLQTERAQRVVPPERWLSCRLAGSTPSSSPSSSPTRSNRITSRTRSGPRR